MSKRKPKPRPEISLSPEAEYAWWWNDEARPAIRRAGYNPDVWLTIPTSVRAEILRGCISVAKYKRSGAKIMSGVSDRLRPLPEQMQHGDFEIDRKIDVKVAVKTNTSLLAVLELRRAITRQQAEAGAEYAKDHAVEFGSGTRDSSVLRIGGVQHETEKQAERAMQARNHMHQILNRCGPGAYAILRQVAVFEQPLGRDRGKNALVYFRLRVALTIAAGVYGIPEYDDSA